MSAIQPLDISLVYGFDGRVEVFPGSHKDLLPNFVQGPPLPPPTSKSFLDDLAAQYLTLDFNTWDTAPAGRVLECLFDDSLVGPESSAPATLVEAVLPDKQGVVGYREVSLSDLDSGRPDLLARQQRLAARTSSDTTWRGFSVSLPFLPGGEPMETHTSSALAAAEEASTGAWLKELESGTLPRVAAPGMQGVFGAWAKEAPADAGGHAAAEAAAADAGEAEQKQQRQEQQEVVDTGGIFDGLWAIEEVEVEPLEVPQEVPVAPETVTVPIQLAPARSVLASLPSVEAVHEAEELSFDHEAVGEAGDLALDSLLDVTESTVQYLTAGPPQRAQAPKPAPAASKHQFAIWGGIDDLEATYNELRPRMALHFPFELDTFQKEAVCHLEAGHSVFVAAHTSAGKTVVAEYAFALATKRCTRAVYTSPIKTISNQKFRDFSGKFDVGLLTGDVQIRPEAPCLIMTTEILRSMLYKGADIVRDIEWVVFDEVHYVNDVDRGVVWEEVIIMLPPHVGLVLLSATVPNVLDFADWVGRTKQKRVYVTGTNRRPVPLEHYLYYSGELFPICSREQFNGDGVRKANAAHDKRNAVPQSTKEEKAARPTGRGDGPPGPNRGGRAGGGRGTSPSKPPSGADRARAAARGHDRGAGPNSSAGMRTERTQLLELIGMLGKRQLLPTAFFTFSKKRCDQAADAVSSLDLTTAAEKHATHVFMERCLARLNEVDRKLPQIGRLRDLTKRGLAVHHAGLLPIMKEIVEMLFCQGLIKVLFCTETFAMGVNAPTRTVVFHSLRKHDGRNFRNLLPSEYTQMAGRAGRRGLDAVGTVLIACWEDIPGELELRQILTGKGGMLASQFRLTYSMILNLLRAEDLKVEDMLKRSFAEFHAQRAMPELNGVLARGERKLEAYRNRPWPACYLGCTRHEVHDYYELTSKINTLNQRVQSAVMTSRQALQQLVPGRLVLVNNGTTGLTQLGVVAGAVDGDSGEGSSRPRLTLTSSSPSEPAASAGEGGRHFYVLLLHSPSAADPQPATPPPAAPETQTGGGEFAGFKLMGASGGKRGAPKGPGPLPRYGAVGGINYMLADVPAMDIVGIGKNKIKVEPEELLDPSNDKALAAAVRNLQKVRDDCKGEEPAMLDPISDLKLNAYELVGDLRLRQALTDQRAKLRPHRCPQLPEQYGLVRSEALLQQRMAALRHKLSDASLQQLPEFHQRVKVLQQLGYVDGERTVTLKGRVACEINSTQDELVASEMLFAGLFSGLTPNEAVALLSVLVFQEKSDVEPTLPENLAQASKDLQQLTLQTAVVQRECGLDLLPDEYARNVLHCGLMEVVHEWARGTPFADICELTDVMEGSIVRAVVRLDQACREMMDAARVMGNTALFQQMEAASAAIKRDVVFAASLYIA